MVLEEGSLVKLLGQSSESSLISTTGAASMVIHFGVTFETGFPQGAVIKLADCPMVLAGQTRWRVNESCVLPEPNPLRGRGRPTFSSQARVARVWSRNPKKYRDERSAPTIS